MRDEKNQRGITGRPRGKEDARERSEEVRGEVRKGDEGNEGGDRCGNRGGARAERGGGDDGERAGGASERGRGGSVDARVERADAIRLAGSASRRRELVGRRVQGSRGAVGGPADAFARVEAPTTRSDESCTPMVSELQTSARFARHAEVHYSNETVRGARDRAHNDAPRGPHAARANASG